MDISKIPLISRDTGLTYYEVVWLYLTLHGDMNVPVVVYPSDSSKKYIIDCSNRLINTKATKELFDKYERSEVPVLDRKVTDIPSWINTYRDLFKGKTPNDDRGQLQRCVDKMRIFITKYPTYASLELILKATAYGIADMQRRSIPVSQADYFISKYKVEGIDEPLHRYCEILYSNQQKPQQTSTNITSKKL